MLKMIELKPITIRWLAQGNNEVESVILDPGPVIMKPSSPLWLAHTASLNIGYDLAIQRVNKNGVKEL